MATLALAGVEALAFTAGTTAAGEAIVISGGAILGSLIDSTLLFPGLLGGPKQYGPRLNDLNIAPNSEGTPLYRLYGTDRLPLALVWQSPLKEIEDSESGGGKGTGAGGEFITYKYRCSAAYVGPRHRINRTKRIWANGQIFYDEQPDLLYESDAISGELSGHTVLGGGGSGTTSTWNTLKLKNSDGTIDLSKYKAGGDLIVAGFTGGAVANNSDNSPTGAWRIVSSKRSGSDPDVTVVEVEHPEFSGLSYGFVTVAAGDTVTVRQSYPLYKSKQVKDIRFYNGEADQPRDPLLDKWILDVDGNVINIPYRHRALYVFEDILVTDFGNRMPNFEVEAEETLEPDLADVYARMLREAGYGEDEFDVSQVTGTVHGYKIRGPQPTAQMLQPLALAYDTIARQVGDRIVLLDRSAAPTVTIDETDLAVHEAGGDVNHPWLAEDDDDLMKPRRFEVQYISAEKDYNTGMKPGFDPTARYDHVDGARLELVLTDEEGQALANKLMAMKRSRDKRITLTLPHTYLETVSEGVVLVVPNVMGETWSLLVESFVMGANFMLECVCRPEDVGALEQPGPSDAPPASIRQEFGGIQDAGGVHVPSVPIAAHIIEVAALADTDANDVVVYVAPYGLETRYGWRGALLYESYDGAAWTMRQVLKGEATVGRVTSAATTVVQPYRWDRMNTIRVELHQGETATKLARGLESRVEDDVLNGANRIAVLTSAGWEIIGFREAKLVTSDPPTYDLTHLLRGLRGTEGAMGSHAVGDSVVLLTGKGIHRVQLNTAAVGGTRYWKFVAPGEDINRARTYTLVPTGASALPLPVSNVEGYRDGSNNLTVRWHRRSRAITRGVSSRKPLFEDHEAYDVEYLASGGSVVLRSVTVERPVGGWTSSLPEAVYSAAEQTSDGISPGDPVKVRVCGVSFRLGRGPVVEETV